MLKSLLPYIADIKRITIINTWWEDYKSYTTTYSSIPCRYYRKNKRLTETNLASETNLDNQRVILEWNYTDIQVWDEIIISDVILWEIWDYLISDVKAQRLFNNISHIELKVTEL